ncbi:MULTISPECIES: hypothetical protein [unclassified Bradyrhizobium]|uniref:hypothetical protein n=1 Tax=unclassified Bradyrhizobium TaxID=2631580 RepID=UPI001FFB083C|nr:MULTISPECIES: hypothetical protein [unclassified Bradyrhizobium]MCK1532845.1 hypothetical protein [Bradyrhizobium sp. 176]MCK1559577.1 hypothetical protein [Bradyrhizobium sp. 171]
MTMLKLLFKGTIGTTTIADTFLSREAYRGTRQHSPEASEQYRQHALDAVEKLRARQAARLKRRA